MIMKLNHIGVATKNVEATTKLLEHMGYHAGDIMRDENQKVDVRFLYSDEAPTIELLFNISGGSSPIDKIVEKNGTSVYHLCYETPDIDAAVADFRMQHYLPIGVKKPSLMDGRNVIFLYHQDNVMIELVEV
jgi:methylmalonyl-CoA/ethylmalonyl-CoA epimerase